MQRGITKERLLGEVKLLRAERDRLLKALPPEARKDFQRLDDGTDGQLGLPLQRHFPVAEFAIGPGQDMPLPETLEDIAESIGRYWAVRLSEGLPQSGERTWRRSVYVPQRLTGSHRLIEILGAEVAHRLAWSHANMILEVPVCADIRRAYRASVARRLQARGASVADVAAELAISHETAEELVRGAPEIPHEGSPEV